MSFKIALAGKGGTGKTTISGLLIKSLLKNNMGPVLGVDADANACLNEVLDTEVDVTINIEPHGPYTTNGDFLERLLTHFDSPHLRVNFDTGNTFIAGLDPLEYLKRFRPYVSHLHVKDVSAGLAEAARGDETGIACSEVPLGGGVNRENIVNCIGYLRETDWSGVLSIECHGSDDNIRQSVDFLRQLLA